MSFTSLLFLFVFLPVSLVLYYLVRDESREYVLLILSLYFYALGSLEYFGIFIIALFFVVTIGRGIAGTANGRIKKILLLIGIFSNCVLLGYYKYSGAAIFKVIDFSRNNVTAIENIGIPLGISFFSFKAISYLVDVYSGKIEVVGNPLHDALYLSFFAQITQGPLSRYSEMRLIIDKTDIFHTGVERFLIGFCKKILLADNLANIANEVFAAELNSYSVLYAWMGAICYSLQLYYDFAGYSDMAIGLSRMFGYNCRENFNYPYMTESVTKFWRRWHISLGNWFRDYIYIPLGGARNQNRYRVYVNLFIVWILTGVWHGASWNFVVWGVGYFIFIVFEKITGMPNRLRNSVAKVLYRLIILLFINFQWIIFRTDNIQTAVGYIKNMLDIASSHKVVDTRFMFLMDDYKFFIFLAIIFCFPVIPWLEKKLESGRYVKFSSIYICVKLITIVISFVWALSFVVAGQNNPFLYKFF